MQFVHTRDGERLYYRDIGKGPTLIFLHGFGMHSMHWLPFVLPLSRRFRIITPDLRGFGHSHHTNFNTDCILSNYAEDLHDLISTLKIKRFKLIGISMGALAALQYQRMHGEEHVSHYLHIDQSPRCLNDNDWQWGLFGEEQAERLTRASELIAALRPLAAEGTRYKALPSALKSALWSELGDFYASALSVGTHKKIVRNLCSRPGIAERMLPTGNWPIYLDCLDAYMHQHYDMRDVFASMSIPLTAIVGLQSDMYPAGGQLRIADYADHCELLTFERSGHTPLIDQPVRFMRTLKRFAEAN